MLTITPPERRSAGKAALVVFDKTENVHLEHRSIFFRRALLRRPKQSVAGIVHQHVKTPNVSTAFATAVLAAAASVTSSGKVIIRPSNGRAMSSISELTFQAVATT